MVGPYRIERFVADNRLVDSYAARHSATDALCMLNLLSASTPPEEAFRMRLKATGKMLARLRHENVICFVDAGESGGRVYLALEYLEGSTLQAWFDATTAGKAGVPPAEVKRIMAQVLQGLAHAHQVGIVHRDLSPRNLWMTPTGQIKITGFLLARALEDPSPELPGRQPSDARSDIWTLGLLTYYLLTGCKPSGPARLASQLVPGLDPRWDEFIRTCLAADPGARYQTAEAALTALLGSEAKISPWRRLLARLS